MKLSHLKLAICPGYCTTRLMQEYIAMDINRDGIYWCYPPFIVNHEGILGFSSPISALNSRLFEYVQNELDIDSFLVGDVYFFHGFPSKVLNASGVDPLIVNKQGWNFLAQLFEV